LNEPLLAGATQVSGWGPAGLQIIIVDVTMGAEQIGATRIEANGTFEAKVPPLPEAHRIGIMSGEALPTEVKRNISELWGPGAIELPMIGKVYASAMTKEQPPTPTTKKMLLWVYCI